MRAVLDCQLHLFLQQMSVGECLYTPQRSGSQKGDQYTDTLTLSKSIPRTEAPWGRHRFAAKLLLTRVTLGIAPPGGAAMITRPPRFEYKNKSDIERRNSTTNSKMKQCCIRMTIKENYRSSVLVFKEIISIQRQLMVINDSSHASSIILSVENILNPPGAHHSWKGLLYFCVAVIEQQICPSAHIIIKRSLSSTTNLIRKKKKRYKIDELFTGRRISELAPVTSLSLQLRILSLTMALRESFWGRRLGGPLIHQPQRLGTFLRQPLPPSLSIRECAIVNLWKPMRTFVPVRLQRSVAKGAGE